MKKAQLVCEKSCQGRIINKERGVYCDHIESRINRSKRQSIKASYYGNIDAMWVMNEKHTSLLEIEEKLRMFGLDHYEIDLIIARVVEGKSMKQLIAEQIRNKEPAWLTANSAGYHYKKALKKLRIGKFKP